MTAKEMLAALGFSKEHSDIFAPIMEEQAQQEAEAFAEWIEENNWFKAVAKNTWICLATDEEFTISGLYQEYLENKRKEKS